MVDLKTSRLAREALIAGQDIDAFRYGFLLIEALYGNGKFQTRDLVRELLDNADFISNDISTPELLTGQASSSLSGRRIGNFSRTSNTLASSWVGQPA